MVRTSWTLLIAVCFLTFNSTLISQTRFGAHAGMNISDMSSGNELLAYTDANGMVTGGSVEFHVAGGLWAYGRIQYIERRANIDDERADSRTASASDRLYREEYEYVEVPVGYKFRFGPTPVNFFMRAGLTGAFLTGGTRYWQLGQGGYSMDDCKPLVERFMLLGHGGIGIEYAITPAVGVAAESVYGIGLSELSSLDHIRSKNIMLMGSVILTVD